MDNASYHCRKSISLPKMSTKKADIVTWLAENGVNHESADKLLKVQLLKKVKESGIKERFVIDDMGERAGHKILRLPPYHCIFILSSTFGAY